jgi:type II secretory pathway pseudopilin PulG
VTLLELAVTIGVLALVATVVVPRLAANADRRLRLAADAAVERLTAARWQAVVEGRSIRIPLDTLSPGVRAIQADGPPGAATQAIEFDPVPAAVPRTIVLAGAGGASARITIPSGFAPLAVSVGDPS